MKTKPDIFFPELSVRTQDSKKTPFHTGWDKNDERQTWLKYIYEKAGEDAMRTFLAENGTMGITTKSRIVGANGFSDYGICQINPGYHPEILGHGGVYGSGKYFVDWFYDPYKQIDHCIKKYKGGTRFYAYNYRFDRTKAIILQ